jgi:hypothetical protein
MQCFICVYINYIKFLKSFCELLYLSWRIFHVHVRRLIYSNSPLQVAPEYEYTVIYLFIVLLVIEKLFLIFLSLKPCCHEYICTVRHGREYYAILVSPCYHPHFTDEKPETQRGKLLPCSYITNEWRNQFPSPHLSDHR